MKQKALLINLPLFLLLAMSLFPGLAARAEVILETPEIPAEYQDKDKKPRPNILFIAVDDLNDMIPLLDPNSIAKTPNLDKLAKKSTVFANAYTAATACNPSRFALLSGRRPSSTGVYQNYSDTYPLEKEYEFLPSFLRRKGYKAIGIGKIFHGLQNLGSVWDEYYSFEKNPKYLEEPVRDYPERNFGAVPEDYLDLRDEQHSKKAVEFLAEEFKEPTFLAVGLYAPHQPWIFTEEELAQYPLSSIEIPVEPEYDLDDMPKIAQEFAYDSDYYELIIKKGAWKRAFQAYLTAITHMDKQIGKVLDALEKGPNKDNTMIVVWSDHGFHLGEKKHWRKHALWEKTAHVLLMFSMPADESLGIEQLGQRTEKVVSLMDVFPTIADLIGAPKQKYMEGKSFKKLIKFPDAKKWKGRAITTMGHKNHSIRTGRWRYTRYENGAEELYDKYFDPKEFYNIEDLKSLKPIKEQLEGLLPEENKKPVKRIRYE